MTEPTAPLITSTQNPKIKRLLALQEKSSERRKSGLFVVEGRRELQHCIAAGYEVESVFVRPLSNSPRGGEDALSPSIKDAIGFAALPPTGGAGRGAVYYVSAHVYERIAYRGSTEGIVAIVKSQHLTLENIGCAALPPTGGAGSGALFIVLERVEKPGNLGAVLRSADAAGATAVIICDPLTDLYNPNLIRASIGACFTVPMVACTSEECIAFFKQHGIRILTAQLQDSELYYDTDMTGPTAIVMGTESTGLTDQWRQAADAHIRIPMLGQLDSLNVSVSAAILLFEAVRQRSEWHTP